MANIVLLQRNKWTASFHIWHGAKITFLLSCLLMQEPQSRKLPPCHDCIMTKRTNLKLIFTYMFHFAKLVSLVMSDTFYFMYRLLFLCELYSDIIWFLMMMMILDSVFCCFYMCIDWWTLQDVLSSPTGQSKSRLMFPNLSMLDISNNQLREIPHNIHELNNLSVLNISGNLGEVLL